MNVVIWTRVSSREQREGYSIDAQLRVTREKARANGWHVVREFEVDESAKRGAERKIFNEMLRWVARTPSERKSRRSSATSSTASAATCGMRSACRNWKTPAACNWPSSRTNSVPARRDLFVQRDGRRRTVLQRQSAPKCIKGLDEKVRQGWPTGLAPFGYINVDDRDEPVQPHPEKSRTLFRIFELYSSGTHVQEPRRQVGRRRARVSARAKPGFNRTALSHILRNRFYVGELHRKGRCLRASIGGLLIGRRSTLARTF